MRRTLTMLLAAAALLAAGYFAGRQASHPRPALLVAPAERKPLYWHDPMYPQHKFDKPGKSPFMDMQLVPVYGDEKSAADSGVAVSARVQQNLGLRSALAETVELREEWPAVGSVQVDERRIVRVEQRSQGWVEKLYVRAVNDPVRAGQVLAEVYSPDLVAAQEEYLLAWRMAQVNPGDEALARAARPRGVSLGFPEGGIAALEGAGVARRRVPLVAPISGVLTELGVREGAQVQPGMPAFTLTDLSLVWIVMEVPEAQAGLLRPGLHARVRAQALGGREFEGRVDYIYPELNAQTRTVKARVVLANPGLALRPGMFAQVTIVAAARRALTVPSESVIQTGTRSVVIVMDGERFRAATVKTGQERDGRTEVVSGLKERERVVTSGQFLIDSEASLKGALDRLEAGGGAGTLHKGYGRVTGVDAAKGRLEIDHEAIASLKWPRMTMEFTVADPGALGKLKKGDAVEFELSGQADEDGDFRIEKIAPRARP